MAKSNTAMMFEFIKTRKKWWLTPIIVISLLLGLLIALTSGTAVAPFIYTLF
jgi:NAD/NADP transhydrogenase beta subunit